MSACAGFGTTDASTSCIAIIPGPNRSSATSRTSGSSSASRVTFDSIASLPA